MRTEYSRGTVVARTEFSRSTLLPAVSPAEIVGQHHGLRNLLHRDAPSPALLLQSEVSLLFGEARVALQDSLRAFQELARLQLACQLRDLGIQSSPLDFGANQMSERRDQLSFPRRVLVRLAVLKVQDSDKPASSQNRDRQERLETVFRQLTEAAKASVSHCAPRSAISQPGAIRP